MFTTCTNCGSRFRLNVAQLTAAQGSVRCGKCGEIFDAYEVLEGADVPPQMPEPSITPKPVETDDVPLQISDEAAPEFEMPMAAEDEPITSAPKLKATRKSQLPIDDLFDGIDAGDPLAREPGIGDLDAVQTAEATPAESVGLDYEDAIKPLPDELADGTPRSYAHVDDLAQPPAPKPRHPLRSGLTWLAVLGLALLLAAQLVDVYRQPLSQNPVIGPSLQALYARLGRPLAGSGSVSQWGVDALNVTTDPDSAGALSITGSLTNGAGAVQPWPELRVVLTDRFGEALRSRDFKPAEYLPAGQAVSQLAPGLSAHFRLDIMDPGAEAVGFSLTPCLEVTAGRICAQPNSAE
ncbi:MAG TPA: DUF3426 domain-containing protein [Gammaproteobacteria bacterium]|jgi:predicted Zn finger-like uncharacterized protein